MRRFGALLAVMLFAVAAGCGGSSKSSDGGSQSGACTFPSCLSAATACVPSGACVSQTTGTSLATCYDNGVKVVETANVVGTSVGLVYALKKGTTTCYSMTLDAAALAVGTSGSPISIPVQNAAGATVATLSVDPTTRQATVTCAGSATPVALDPSCGSALSFTSTGTPTNCTQGTCAP